ncbi:GNAT family N-acetyltransferase [Spongisporangium articulatum]|uniref:GNAT family N-acetyltransferase n=1 Tax=Spongisporangium articulatum TaxID=3362603 RepID=A0ABW8AJN1_9ACTN
MSAPVTRLATLDDVDAVVTTVAAAFAADPAWSFMLGPENLAARRSFARALLLPRIHRGTAWLVDDGAAVALWDRLSGVAPDDGHDTDWTAFAAEVGDLAWARIEAYEHAIESVAPSPPYWYLGVLATHPDLHGQGLATAVMQPGFEAAAADGWDCWLETSTEPNKAFYERRGFRESRAVVVPGGPPTWWLRRPHV